MSPGRPEPALRLTTALLNSQMAVFLGPTILSVSSQPAPTGPLFPCFHGSPKRGGDRGSPGPWQLGGSLLEMVRLRKEGTCDPHSGAATFEAGASSPGEGLASGGGAARGKLGEARGTALPPAPASQGF